MITIKKKFTSETACEPERELTAEEKAQVICSYGDAGNFWFFTAEDKENNTTEWQQYQAALNYTAE